MDNNEHDDNDDTNGQYDYNDIVYYLLGDRSTRIMKRVVTIIMLLMLRLLLIPFMMRTLLITIIQLKRRTMRILKPQTNGNAAKHANHANTANCANHATATTTTTSTSTLR